MTEPTPPGTAVIDERSTTAGGDDATSAAPAVAITTTAVNAAVFTVQQQTSPRYGGEGTDAKPVPGGGYGSGGGGHRHAGGYDERDGETMVTTPGASFGGDAFPPPAEKPTPSPPDSGAEPPINTRAAESTAFVVLVTAATLIVIVLVILLVLKVKYRTDTNRYKIDVPKAYGAADRGAPVLCRGHQLLSPGGDNYPPSRQSSSPTYVQNNYRPHVPSNGKPKKRQDVKEWYV